MAANQVLAPRTNTDVRPQRQKNDDRGRLGVLLSEYVGERALRQIGLIIGLAVAVAAGLALFMWAQEPTYRALYANLPMEDAGAVVEALQAANIPYHLDGGSGAILVPAQRLSEARLKLAGQGLPHTGGVGFESLRQDQGFGTSQFIETARFQRALETELARTIDSLDPIARTRVHLAIPERSVFVRERKAPSAAVSIGLYPGRTLTPGQVSAITHLVASAVPGMAATEVTVVDQRGQLLSRPEDNGEGLNETVQQLDFRHRVEDAYARRIEDLLAPIVGAGHVKAEVNARIEFAAQERTEELYQPGQSVVRSERSTEDRTERSKEAMGIPGALSNQPPGTGTLQPVQSAPAQPAQPGQSSQVAAQTPSPPPPLVDSRVSHTRNYEVSKTIRHVRAPRGAITRLSVAVLLDRPTVAAADGKAQPLSPAKLAEITGLVKQVVGFDPARGDTINVISSPFQPSEDAAPLGTPLWQQPWASEAGKLLLASILGLVLILAVVRPLVHGLLGRDRSEQPEPVPVAQPPALEAGVSAGYSLPSPDERRQSDAMSDYDKRLRIARDVAGKEPAVAANVMKRWLAQEHE